MLSFFINEIQFVVTLNTLNSWTDFSPGLMVCVGLRMCESVCVCVWLYVYVCAHKVLNVGVCICIYVCVCRSVCIPVHGCMLVCMHVCVCTCPIDQKAVFLTQQRTFNGRLLWLCSVCGRLPRTFPATNKRCISAAPLQFKSCFYKAW